MNVCISCKKIFNGKVYPEGKCQACYKYFNKGGKIYHLPENGKIERDEKGNVICHMCGRTYKRLGSHIKESHNMSIYEYKEKFGLCNKCSTTEQGYSDMMRKYAYANGMDERLKISGKNTQIQKDNPLRQGKKSRLQECIERSERYKHANKKISNKEDK